MIYNISIIYDITYNMYHVYTISIYIYIFFFVRMYIYVHIHQIVISQKLSHISQGSIPWGGYLIYPNKLRLLGHEAVIFLRIKYQLI